VIRPSRQTDHNAVADGTAFVSAEVFDAEPQLGPDSVKGLIVDRIEAHKNVIRFTDGTIADVRLVGTGLQALIGRQGPAGAGRAVEVVPGDGHGPATIDD
jgi:hypothetical protein